MSPEQIKSFQAYWWPAAARAQKWKASDRDLRLRVCSWIVSLMNPSQHELLEAINSDRLPPHRLASITDLTDEDQITAVKKCLGMLADNLAATGEVGHPEFNRARQKRNIIRGHIKCLALFEAHPKRYLAALIRDMFASKHGPDITIKELADAGKYPSDLQRLVMRIAQIVNDKRNQNVLVPAWAHLQGTEPMTIHEMKLTAGIRCDCAICSRLDRGQLLPPIPVEENWQDFDPELETVTDEFGGSAGDEGGDPF